MNFTFKTFKKMEFDSALKSMIHDNGIHVPGIVVTYNNDYEKTTAVVNDAIVEKLSKNQIATLTNIN